MEKQTNREHVVAVASDLFLRRGIAETSMDDVVRESRVAKSNIYYHFKSKDELLVAVVDHRIAHFEQAVLEPLTSRPATSVMAGLQRFVESLTAELAGRDCVGGCPFISLAIQAAETNHAVKERVARFFKEQTQQLEGMIAHGIALGEVRPDLQPAEAAGLLISAIEGSLFLAEVNHDSRLLERRALLLLELLRPIP
jgi:TetR/AcrR family transcriptional repressor of nem operon